MRRCVEFVLLVHFQRHSLLQSWKAFEEEHGIELDVAKVQDMMPEAKKNPQED